MGIKRETRQKQEENNQYNNYHYCRFRAPPIELNESKQNKKLPLTAGFRAIV